VTINRFIWTDHAEFRREQRHLDRTAIEHAIANGHDDRQVNDGRAEWLLTGKTAEHVPFEVVYDHPHGTDENAVRIVSVWRLDS
jgi:hypothetical protein